MSTYWPGRDNPDPEMATLCRFCGFGRDVAERMVGGCESHGGGHEYVEVNRHAVGAVGGGTPAARMRWFWDELEPHYALLESVGFDRLSSSVAAMPEVAVLRFLQRAGIATGGEA